jgi:fructose-bisphosphate aldolase, class I
MNRQEIADTASAMVSPGKGLLAMDESNEMNAKYGSRLPWPLSFSYARAIQQPALQLWQGLDANKKVAQEALLYRAKCNRAARQGKYTEEMEMGEPALVGAEVQHSHLASQD